MLLAALLEAPAERHAAARHATAPPLRGARLLGPGRAREVVPPERAERPYRHRQAECAPSVRMAAACEHLHALRSSVPSLGPLGRAVCAERRNAPCGADVVCLACGSARDRAAAARHSAEAGAGHAIGVDVARCVLRQSSSDASCFAPRAATAALTRQRSAELYCGACGDFVYDTSFDRAVAGSRAGGAAAAPAPASGGHKRKARTWGALAEPLAPGPPGDGGAGAEAAAAVAQQQPPACAPIQEVVPPLGLRGLNNLGNTCFIASVLQAHYLSGGHAAGACAARRRARGAAAAAAPCLACELDAAFARAFAPPPPGARRQPWSPAALLAAWWRSAEALASYQQQDAHEFFLSLLEAVHTATASCVGSGSANAAGGSATPRAAAAALLRSPSGLGSPRAGFGAGAGGCDADCGCAMHRAFGGLLRSDVVCAGCGGVSTSLDPFVDVSLELAASPSGAAAPPLTLASCLRRFTRPERLGGGARVLACASCGALQAGTKQLSFAAAPPALCLHLKRFAHGDGARAAGGGDGGGAGGAAAAAAAAAEASKLDAHVAFPLDDLDLGPFLAPARLRARAGLRVSGEATAGGCSDAPRCRYWLAAAVCHVGSLEGGHYVAYARHGGSWFRCDDSWVAAAPPAEVAAQQAYLLFYVAHAVTAQRPPCA